MIHIEKTHFIHNQVNSVLSDIIPSNRYRGYDNIKFSNCIFFNNSMFDNYYLINTNGLYSVSLINCLFYKNNCLFLTSMSQTLSSKIQHFHLAFGIFLLLIYSWEI